MKAGFSKTIITPQYGTGIPGYFENRMATGKKNELYTYAAAFGEGENGIILISIDMVDFQSRLSTHIRKEVSAKTGVPFERILVAATHTHTGPTTNYPVFGCPADETVTDRLEALAAENAQKAWGNRREATLSMGTDREENFGFNRTYLLKDGSIKTNPGSKRRDQIVRPAGDIDRSVEVLRVDGTDGKPIGFVVNYACHPDTVGGTQFCTDWPGVMREKVEEQFGEDVLVIFFNGTAGDINHVDPVNETHLIPEKNGIPFYQAMGAAITEDVLRANEKRTKCKNDVLDALSVKYVEPRRLPTEEDYRWAKEVMNDPYGKPLTDIIYASEFLCIERQEDDLRTRAYEIQTLRLGDWAIVGIPGEVFTEIGLKIKARSPFEKTVVFELSNGSLGYLATDLILHSKAYEAKTALYNSTMPEGTADLIVEHALAQLNKMKEKAE